MKKVSNFGYHFHMYIININIFRCLVALILAFNQLIYKIYPNQIILSIHGDKITQ